MPRSKIVIAALVAAIPNVHAAGEEAVAACRAIEDAAARLACYDALPLAAPPSRMPVPATAARPAPPAAAAAAPAQNDATRFGLPATASVQPRPLEFVESHIEGHFSGWYPGTRIRLANGQVWQVTDGSSRFADVDNAKVTVRRGALGSFFLDIDGVNPAPRVKRVE